MDEHLSTDLAEEQLVDQLKQKKATKKKPDSTVSNKFALINDDAADAIERKRLDKLKAKQDKISEINHQAQNDNNEEELSLKKAVKSGDSKRKKKQLIENN